MNNYMLLFRSGLDFATASPEEMQGVMMKWKTWMDDLYAKGLMTGGERLEMGRGAVLNVNKEQSDGPYAEGKEIVSGFLSVQANSLDEAVELAKGCPIFEHNGFVEVREIAPRTTS